MKWRVLFLLLIIMALIGLNVGVWAVFQRAARVGSAAVEVQSDTHADAIYRRALLETMLVRAFKMAASN